MNEGSATHRNARQAKTLDTLLPVRDPRLARVRRCIAGLRARHSCWRELIVPLAPSESSASASGDQAEITIDCRHGRLGIRVGTPFPALLACSRIADMTTRNAVATLLTTETLPNWLASTADTDPYWQARVEPTNGGEPAPCLPFGLRLGSGKTDCAPITDISPALLAAIESFVQGNRAGLPERMTALRIPGRIVLDRRTVSVDSLRRLRCGDVLLTRFCAATTIGDALAGSRFSLTWGNPALAHLRASIQLEDACVTLQTHPELAVDDVDANDFATNAATDENFPAGDKTAADTADVDVSGNATLVGLAGMQVPLLVAIEAPAMTLAELAALEPGVAIELPERAETARVRVTAHGQLLALGRLVVVGDRLGVEITRLDRKIAGADA